MLVVSRLNWDLASVLPSDFLELLLQALPLKAQNHAAVRRHAHSYIALSATGTSHAHNVKISSPCTRQQLLCPPAAAVDPALCWLYKPRVTYIMSRFCSPALGFQHLLL